MKGVGVLGAIMILAASTVSGLLTYGVYGSLRDRKWGPWKAGATTGAVSGALGVIAFFALGDRMAMMAKQNMGMIVSQKMGALTPARLPTHLKNTSALVMNQIGCASCR